MPQSMLGIGGGLVAPRATGDYDYLPVAYNSNFQKVFGRIPGPLDSAALAKIEDGNNLDWSPIDREYDGRALVNLSPIMTAQAVNEIYGMPFVMLATQIVITHDRKWTVMRRERIMDGYVQVGPTGIPRSSSFTNRATSGEISRYKHWHQMPNEKLADPNFGLDNYLDMLDDFKAQLNHTIMIQVATEIASRHHRNQLDKALHREQPYSYLDHYRETTDHFCYGALNPEKFTRTITTNMTGVPRMNTVLVPDVNCGSLAADIDENRAFKGHVRDETRTTRDLSETLDALRTEPVGVFGPRIGSQSETNILLTIPTFFSHSEDGPEMGYQPLEREILLGGAYMFPYPDYATADGLSPHSTMTSVLQLHPNEARWRRVRLSDALRATRGGFLFASSAAGAEPSARVKNLLAIWNADDGFPSYHMQNLANAKDRDTPSDYARQMARAARRLSDIHGFREFPWIFRPVMVPNNAAALDGTWSLTDDVNKVRFVRRLGQFTEDVLPVRHWVDILGAIERQGAGKGADGAKNLLAQIVGISPAALDTALAKIGGAPAQAWNPDAGGEVGQILELSARARGAVVRVVAPGGVRGPRAEEPDEDAEHQPALRPQKLRPFAQTFLSFIPDSAFDAFAPIVPTLEKLNEQQPEAATAISDKLKAAAAAYQSDSALHGIALQLVLERLAELGICPYSARTN